jgi:hypothetical protein
MIGKNNGFAAFFLRFHSILHQEATCAKGLKMNHVIDTAVKTVHFIRASALNQHESEALLEDVESERGELVCGASVRWLCLPVCFETTVVLFVERDEVIHGKEGQKY